MRFIPIFYRRIAVAMFTLIAIPVLVLAQAESGQIAGTVTDQNGGLVPGASVMARNEKTGEERTATSTSDGTYIISSLKPSVYTVTVTSTGLATTATNVQVLVGQSVKLDLVVKPEELRAMIDISSGGESIVDTSSAANGANVNPREVQGLPINGRQLSQLYLQAPGAVNSGSGTFGDIRFSGRAVEQNTVKYDGIEGTAIIDSSPGNLNGEVPTPFRLQSSLENVQEFRVDSNNYPAEQGTGTGGQINVLTKSGGNKFHGSLFEFFRNDALDAANFFDNSNPLVHKSPLRLNQFGGSIGGPIKKDKAFFFFSYEGYRLRGGINTIETVPGFQSRICPGGIILGTTNTPCNPATAALIPGFRDPAAVTLRVGPDLFDTVQLQATNIVNENSAALRLDYRFNSKQSMYFRFFRDQGTNLQPDGVTGRKIAIRDIPQNGVIALQSVISPTMLNEFKVGYNSALTRINGLAPTVAGVDFSNLSLNISGSVAGFALPGQGANAGVASPGGLIRANSAQNGRGQPYTPYSISFVDNLIWSRGTPGLMFGGELRLIRLYPIGKGHHLYLCQHHQLFDEFSVLRAVPR